MTCDDLGFSWRLAPDGAILISFKGRVVTTLKKAKAADFLAEAEGASSGELQQLLARLTGQFKHGNERVAKRHPRNH